MLFRSDKYDGALTKVITHGSETKDFPMRIGLHQGSSLGAYLFNLVIDALTESIIGEVHVYMF